MTPQDDSLRRRSLERFVESAELFQATGEQEALGESLRYGREALRLTPPGHDDRPALLNTLADFLGLWYALTGHREALQEAIGFAREVAELTPAWDTDRPALLNNLGNHLHRWYALTGDEGSLAEAIDCNREAVELTPPGHSDLPSRLNNLGTHLRAWYARTGQRDSLEQAVSYARQAVELTPPGHPDRPSWMNSLGNQLGDWYSLTADRKTLAEAIDCAREAVDQTPPAHSDRPAWLNNLGSHLSLWYALTGERKALEEAIRCARDAVEQTPDGPGDRPGYLNNLGSHLSDWYALTGEQESLDEAIDVARESVKPERTPPEHSDRPSRLNNLANHLSVRYVLTGDGDTLAEAIRWAREAVTESPDGHSLLPGYLMNLGNRLSDWSALTGDQNALVEAIGYARQALSLLEPGHSNESVSLNNLGNYVSALYALTGDSKLLEEAISYARAAVAASSRTRDEVPPTRLRGLYMSLAGHLMNRDQANDWAEAHQILTTALRQQVDELGRQTGERSGLDYLRGKEEIYGMSIQCGLELARRSEREGRLTDAQALRDQAWFTAEQGKGRLFAALLLAERQALAGTGNPRVTELLTRIDSLRRERAALETAKVWHGDKAENSALQEERSRRMKEIRRQTEEFVGELRILDPELASLTASQPQPLDAIRTVLDPGAVLLEFYPLVDELVLFAVDREGLRVRSAPVSLAQLSDWTRQLNRYVHPEPGTHSAPAEAVAGFEHLLTELGAIVEPVLHDLLGPTRLMTPSDAAPELIIVPTGPLHRWPLHLLPWGEGILWDSWSVSYVPTADTLFYCAGRRPEGEHQPLLLAPDPGLVGSFGEALLAEALGWRVAVQEAATLQTVADSQGNLALVTHVEARPQLGTTSAIRLWVGECLGWVTAVEILQFIADRRPAEHGELATCGAHYEESLTGDHLQGLTRSFLKARLRSLTTTLWRVEDMASCYVGARSRDLMTKGGRSKAACLRQAALELRDNGWAGAAEWLEDTVPRVREGRHLILSLAAQYQRMAGQLYPALALWDRAQAMKEDEGPYAAAFEPLQRDLGHWASRMRKVLQFARDDGARLMVAPLTALQWGPNVLIGDSQMANGSKSV